MTNTINFVIPPYYSDITNNQIETGKSFVGADFRNMALNANYLLANGNQKIPISYVGQGFLPTDYYFKIFDYVQPNINERYWLFGFSGADAVGKMNIVMTSSIDNTITTASLNMNIGLNTTVFYEKLNYTSSNTYTTNSIDIKITPSSSIGSPSPVFEYFSLYDAPRTYLNPTSQSTDLAIDVASVTPNKSIFTTPSNHNSSYSGIVNGVTSYYGSRKSGKGLLGIFKFYGTSTSNPNYRTSNVIYANNTTKVNAFSVGALNTAKPIIFATQEDKTSTSRLCVVWAYGACEVAANTGRFEITSSVSNASIDFTSTTPTWKSTVLAIQTENVLDSTNGLNTFISQSDGNLDINAWKPVHTSGQFNVWSVQIFEL